jgi:predicted unusual protein kinase regulating ubiquinone biosynthesis (AarF/ABC1/UbiB family)
LESYSTILRKETDFVAEAQAASAVRDLLAATMPTDVLVPKPLMWADGVIIMEYVPYIPVGNSVDIQSVTLKIIETIMVLICSGGWFHQDPHEGNLGIVCAGGRERLVMYDFGNVARLSPAMLDGMLEVGVAYHLKDSKMMVSSIVRNDVVTAVSGAVDQGTLVEMIEQGVEYARNMDMRSFDPSKLDKKMANNMVVHPEIRCVIRAVTMSEGVCKSVNDRFDLESTIDQIIAVHAPRIIHEKAVRDLSTLL